MANQALLDVDALLDRIAAHLAGQFTGVFSAETVDRYVHKSYTAFAPHRPDQGLPAHPHRALSRRPAHRAGPGPRRDRRAGPELLLVSMHTRAASQMAAALISRAASTSAPS